MEKYQAQTIFIDEHLKEHPYVKSILNNLNTIPIQYISSDFDLKSLYSDTKDQITEGKKYLYLTENKGSFVKKCPGTNGFICCNYYVIDLVENCHFECSYCFLQNYLTDKVIKVYVNFEKLFLELDELLSGNQALYRIGTGELSDSLALDNITGISKILIEYIANKKNAILELKTKSNMIEKLMDIDHNGKTVISWSLNPQSIIDSDELKTASLEDRLKAALKCQEKGYQLAFHFDPIIYFKGWEDEYRNLIEMLFSRIDSKKVAWLSLGGFRYNKPMDKTIEERFEFSNIIYNEFFESPDGKMRYFIKIREKMYEKMLSILKENAEDLFVYLCMEGKYMWEKVYGFSPKNDQNLDKLFIKRQNDIAQ